MSSVLTSVASAPCADANAFTFCAASSCETVEVELELDGYPVYSIATRTIARIIVEIAQ